MEKGKKNPLERIYFPVRKVKASEFIKAKSDLIFTDSMDHLIIVETPNGKLAVNACSKNYELISNKELLEPFADALGGAHNLQIKVAHRDFSKFYVDFIIKEDQTKLRLKKDEYFSRFRWINSYDGSVRYQLSGGLYRCVCDNQASVPVEGTKDKIIKMMHTPAAGDENALKRSLAAVEEFLSASPELIKRYLPMMEKKLSFEAAIKRMEEVREETEYPKKLIEAAAARLKVEQGLGFAINDYLIYQSLNFALYRGDIAMMPHKMDKLDQQVVQFLYNENK